MIESTANIHETAVVDLPCTIGHKASVWHFSHVREDAEVGAGSNIGQGAYIGKGVKIGRACKVQNNVSIYEDVTLEDEVFCGPSCVFTNVTNPRAAIDRKHEFLPTLVKRGATIGANATIVCGVTIGRWAFIGAGATVTRDVPDFALVIGCPARGTGWMSIYGEKLPPIVVGGQWTCPNTGHIYLLETVSRLRLLSPPPPVKELN